MRTPTGNLEGGVVADDAESGLRVGGVAVVHSHVRPTVLLVDDSQEEQLSARQQHPMRTGVLVGGDHRPAVAIPRDHGRRTALGLQITSNRLFRMAATNAGLKRNYTVLCRRPGFKSQPRRCRVTVLGKLLTPIVPLFTKQRNW